MRSRLGRLRSAGHEIGLHPSFHAFSHDRYLARERDLLEKELGYAPTSVRAHYLRWDDPATPRLFEQAGFRIDSTLGFADGTGFRHGTTMPFRLWDSRSERPLNVWEMPLAMMESALFNRSGLDPQQAEERTRELATTCQRHGGALVGLWHTTLWDEIDCPGWGDHFVSTLNHGRNAGAATLSLSDALATWAPAADPAVTP